MKKFLRIWRLLNLPCDEIVRLVSLSLDEELPRAERIAVKTHLIYCKACRRYRRQINSLRIAIRRYLEQPPMHPATSGMSLSPQARDRIKRSMTSGD